MENFHGFALDMFCFRQVYKVSKENFCGLLKIRKTFLLHNFCHLQYANMYTKEIKLVCLNYTWLIKGIQFLPSL